MLRKNLLELYKYVIRHNWGDLLEWLEMMERFCLEGFSYWNFAYLGNKEHIPKLEISQMRKVKTNFY